MSGGWTTAPGNIMIGFEAGKDITEAFYNVAFGFRAAQNLTNGDYNFACGFQSLGSITTGNRNICIGRETGEALTTQNDNIYIGYKSGETATESSTLRIHNASTESATPLILGSFASGSESLTFHTDTLKIGSPGNIATNYMEFEADGTLKMNGSATVFDDLRFPATSVNPPGLVSDPDWDNTNGGWLFDSGSTEQLWIIGQMPHSWKEGSDVTPHIHWWPTSTNTGDVYWRLEYKWTNINGTDAGAFTTVNIQDAGDGTNLKHQVASFGTISGAGKTISSMLIMKVSRIGGDVLDTYTADALFREFDIHYEMDTLGSRAILTK